jgi:hypothetical protein
LRTFVNLTRADRGLDAQGVITAWVSLPEFAFKERAARQAFASALDERLRQLPGVQQVSLSLGRPSRGGSLYFSRHGRTRGHSRVRPLPRCVG